MGTAGKTSDSIMLELVRDKRWKWRQGMITACGAIVVEATPALSIGPGRWTLLLARWDELRGEWRVGYHFCPRTGDLLPDLDDAGTVGHLRAVVREAWPAVHGHIEVRRYQNGHHVFWRVVTQTGLILGYGATEVEALKTALTGAP